MSSPFPARPSLGRLWREPSREHDAQPACEHQKTDGGHWEAPFGVQISAVNPSTWHGRGRLGVSSGVGVRHREAFRHEKRADGERGGGDQQPAKHGGGQHREIPSAHARFGHGGIRPQNAMQRRALTHMVNCFLSVARQRGPLGCGPGYGAKPAPNMTPSPTAKTKRVMAGIVEPFGVQVSAENPTARRGRGRLGVSDGMGVRHREAFHDENANQR